MDAAHTEESYSSVKPGCIDPMTAVVQRVKGFAYYSLSFSRHNKNIPDTLAPGLQLSTWYQLFHTAWMVHLYYSPFHIR